MVKRQSLIFQAPRTIVISESELPDPGPGEVLVEATISAISPGTEMLFYRGQIPEGIAVDDTIESLASEFSYPLPYGYALVGSVTAVGPRVDSTWLGREVFVFSPHQSHAICPVTDLIIVPENLAPQDAVLLPFMETAVSFLMDGQPMIGEQVVLFGQGIIGLLTTALLSQYPLASLLTVDPVPLRRDWSIRLGARKALDPLTPDFPQQLSDALRENGTTAGADLVFELSGNPYSLNQAIDCCAFDGRLLVGSWYGRKVAPVDLGGHFHRSQIKIISSQVSHIAPRWRGRFDKPRRLQVALEMLARHQPQKLITHHFHIADAAQAYQLLDEAPESAVQIVLDYQG